MSLTSSHKEKLEVSSAKEIVKSTSLSSKESFQRSRGYPKKVSDKNAYKQAKHYWLSESHTLNENRFSVLQIDENSDDVTPKADKPPPIYVQNVERIWVLHDALAKLSDTSYELRILRNNEVKIILANSTYYSKIIDFLRSKETEF